MKLPVRHTPAACVRNGAPRSGEAGSALLVVFILLTLMVTFVVSQSLTLHHLKRELRLIERRQLQRYEAVAGANAPARLPKGQVQPQRGATNSNRDPGHPL